MNQPCEITLILNQLTNGKPDNAQEIILVLLNNHGLPSPIGLRIVVY